MADTDTLEAPAIDEQGQPTPPQDGDDKLRALHTAVGKEYHLGTFEEFKQNIQNPTKRKAFYDAVGKQYDLGKYDEFEKKISGSIAQTAPAAPQVPPPPEHEIQHTTLHDARHLQEMANKPVVTQSTATGGLGGGVGSYTPDTEAIASNKAYKDQYDKSATDLATQWGTKPEVVKQTLADFPDEQDENKLKNFASLATENPVSYGRLKNSNDIRMKIAADGPEGVHDANIFNHLQGAQNYDELTQENIPIQMQIMRQHNLSQVDMEKLKESQRPLINSLDPGLLHKQWNGPDKELGLTADEFAGLETERLFNPNKAEMDLGILKHSRGIGDDGKANPLDLSKESYEYQRGVENVRYNLEQTGRENKARYVAEMKPDVDKQVAALKADYQNRINAAPQQEQPALIQEFMNHPIVQEANKLEDASGDLQYSQNEDQRRYPLNFADQATREVKEAMDHTNGALGDTGHFFGNMFEKAGESADNTLRWIKNTAINIAGSEAQKSFNNAKNIGHQALTELSSFDPNSYTGKESPLIVPRENINEVRNIFNDNNLSDSEKEQKAISYVRDNFDKLTVNPKAGQQNMTGKAALFQASNVMGQILGIANQSFLLGGAIGDASKLQQMATAFTPMYMSTQNQMYEQALKNGDENPYAKSTVDAAIISLASLINPDIKVVKGMVGADSGLGKMIAGIDESTWNKVLSTNKPWVDRTIAAAKATGRQLGLANLQYGVIAPTAEAISHKVLFNEDANLGDKIKDGIIQTSIQMALPALLHGVWGGVRATEVNPNQKYAIVEAGLHPDQNIDLIESKIKSGAMPEIQGHEMKQLIKHSGEILQNTEMVKTDGTPMNENEVADTVYNMLRLRTLEGKMKTAAEPVKPIIEDKIHEINKDIADLHTAPGAPLGELNQLLHDNLDRIKDKAPELEQKVKDAIAANTPEDIYKIISDKAEETKKVEDKEVSLRPEVEKIFGKPLVEKAIELSKQSKTKNNGKTNEAEAGNEKALLSKEQPEGAAVPGQGTVPSISENLNTQDNAVQEPSAGSLLQHPQEGIGSEGGERSGMELSQQGQIPPQESGGAQAQQPGGPIPPKEVNPDELPFGNLPVGIAHHLQEARSAAELNVAPPERGEGITAEQSIERGKQLIAEGTDPDKVVADFKKDNRLSSEDMAVVRARYNELAQKTNKAYDQSGEDSSEAKSAFKAERDWYDNAVKPMQTEWSRIGTAQQGAVDLDTGSVTAIKRAFREQSGKPMTEAQSEKAKDLHAKIKERDKTIEKLQTKLDEVINKHSSSEAGIKEKAQGLAKKIRDNAKLNRPGMFSAATPASLVWDGAVEVVAKSIEAGGAIAEAIGKGIDHIKASDWYKGLSKDQQQNAEKQFSDWHKDQSTGKIDISKHFVDKKDNNFTPEETKAVWEHAKGIIKSGKTDFNDVVAQTAMDTGLTSEQVRRAISQPKGAKTVTDKMYAEMYRLNQLTQHAKAWVQSADQSATKKFFTSLIRIPSAIVTFGHGSVAPITHVGADLYRPSNWKSYFNFMLDSYKFSFGGVTDAGKARYEKAMADLVRDPMFMMAKRSGLKIDPTDLTGDDYSMYQGVFKRIAKMGERGFNAMKPYRLEQFKKIYNGLSDQAKSNDDVIKAISHMVNLSSGTTDVKIPTGTDAVFFAPKLVTSQYQRIFSEPAKAVSTFVNWKNATDPQKLQAKMVARHAGEMVATYMATLAANQAILSMTGSKQKINFTNPLDSDWMKFKVGGKAIDASGGMNSSLRFVGSLIEEGARANGIMKTSEKSKPGDVEGSKILQQLSNKLSPAAADIKEVMSGTDMMGNPLPWSSVKPGTGKEKLTWLGYMESKFPIPIAEGMKTFHDAAKEKGVPESTLNNYLEAILIGGLTGTTGAHIGPDTQKKEASAGRKPRGE